MRIVDFSDLARTGRALRRAFAAARRAGEHQTPWDWMDLSPVRAHLNQIISHDPAKDYIETLAARHIKRFEPVVGLSLGTGQGQTELRWVKACRFRELRGIELRREFVRAANELAREHYRPELVFVRGDLKRFPLSPSYYDFIFSDRILHHFQPVDVMIENVFRSLKPGGIWIVLDYIGPNRLQYNQVQVAEINRMLSAIPARFRTRYWSASIKKRVDASGFLFMMLTKPFEAPQSREILPALQTRMKTVDLFELGGTILAPLLEDIEVNFAEPDPQGAEILRKCIRFEQELLTAHRLSSDYVLGIFQK